MIYSSLKPTPGKLTLSVGEIHIWHALLDQPQTVSNRLIQLLSNDERARAERFHFEQDRRRFTVGRGILRMILGYYLSVEPSLVHFTHGKNGKPRLTDTSGNATIHFNMSDSEGLALYGFTRDREIGVDIERVRDIPGTERMAGRFFSQSEYETLSSLPDNERKEAFFKCWTRKEAFIKATGNGLSLPLDKFAVSLAPGEPARLLAMEGNSKEASRWSIQDLKPASGFAAAFAIKAHNLSVHFWHWLSPGLFGIPMKADSDSHRSGLSNSVKRSIDEERRTPILQFIFSNYVSGKAIPLNINHMQYNLGEKGKLTCEGT